MRKIWKILLGIFTIGLLAGVVWFYFVYQQPKNKLARYRAKLLASGEVFEVSRLAVRPYSTNSSRVVEFYKARNIISPKSGVLITNPPMAMQMVGPGKAAVGWLQPNLCDGRATNTWEEAEAEAARIEPGLQILTDMGPHPMLDFGLDYSQGFEMLLPHLAPLKQSASRLSAASLIALREGKPAIAAKYIAAMLGLARGLEEEPLVISQLVRLAMIQIAMATTWETLQSPNVSEESLAELQAEWSNLDFLKPALGSLVMERALTGEIIERMRNSSASFRRVASGFNGRSGPTAWLTDFGQMSIFKAKETMWRASWSYPDELHSLQGLQVLIEGLRDMETNQAYGPVLQKVDNRLVGLGYDVTSPREDAMIFDMGNIKLKDLFSSGILSVRPVLRKVMAQESARRLVLTALALQRYHLAHGDYPAELASLGASLRPEARTDPMNGKPLVYRRNEDKHFTLYAVGENGVDDGGDGGHAEGREHGWQKGRDLIWPEAASAQEVAAYMERKFPHRTSTNSSTNTAMTAAANEAFRKRYGLPSAATNSANVSGGGSSPTNTP
jgi:hypothetical protein